MKVFSLTPGVNETRFIVQHELCEYKCELNKIACNSEQKWNANKWWCEYKELDNWGSCEKES